MTGRTYLLILFYLRNGQFGCRYFYYYCFVIIVFIAFIIGCGCVCYDCENNRQKNSYAMDNLVVVIFIIVVLLLLLSFISLLGAIVFVFVMKMTVSFTHSTNLLLSSSTHYIFCIHNLNSLSAK